MPAQIPVSSRAWSEDPRGNAADDGTHQIAVDLAYRRLAIVNVTFFGLPAAGDRGWVLIDAGVIGTTSLITEAAKERFGAYARPAAIIITHGHFDHVGGLEELTQRWCPFMRIRWNGLTSTAAPPILHPTPPWAAD
jgi:glyoxylase-like metal-dependent hydrolase (beta-lactamase superfamily II)